MDPLPPLILALLSPDLHAGCVDAPCVLQTHISWVVLAGGLAYKIKKPVKFSFLDFSTLEQRKHSCEDELRLNRRYSPDLYLEVVGIFNTPADPQWQGIGKPIEYAVKMRRFDQRGRLDKVCARGELLPQHLSDLARAVVAFHGEAAIAPAESAFGSDAGVMAQAMQNFQDLLQSFPDRAVQLRLLALEQWTEIQHRQLAALMLARKQAGLVRECHGDLHLANLVLLDRKVRLFDCIEFNPDLRWIDVASELAFAYVDLLAHNKPGLATWFLNEALACSGDYQSAPLIRFYAVYRALVRAKVAMLQTPHTSGTLKQALAYIALAERLGSLPPPLLLITHGVSGSGKTHASDRVLQSDAHAATLRLRTDVERKRLFGLDALQASGSRLNSGLYAPDASAQTYAHVYAVAESLLRSNWSVIVDGTFLLRSQRALFRQLARRQNVDFSILAMHAAPRQLCERILSRSALGRDASEASLEVLAQQQKALEPLAGDEPVWPIRESAAPRAT